MSSMIFYRYTRWYRLLLFTFATTLFLFCIEPFFLRFLSLIPLFTLARRIAENMNLLPKKTLAILDKDGITVPEAFTFGYSTKMVPWGSIKEITACRKYQCKRSRKVIELSLGKRTFWYHDSVDIPIDDLEVSPSEFLMHTKQYYNGKCSNLLDRFSWLFK